MAEEEKIDGIEEDQDVVEEEVKPSFLSNIKGKAGKILGFIIGAILVILISIGASVWVGKKLNKDRIREIGGKIHIPPPPPYATQDLGEFTISIPGDDEEPHFIRFKISLAYKERDLSLAAELSKRRIQIKDSINKIVKRKHKRDLDKIEGTDNLKIELKEVINQFLQSGEIKDVYFESITVL